MTINHKDELVNFQRVPETPDYLIMHLGNDPESRAIAATIPFGVSLISQSLPRLIEPPYGFQNNENELGFIIELENISAIQTMPPVDSPINFLYEIKTNQYGLKQSDIAIFERLIVGAQKLQKLDDLTNQALFSIFEIMANDSGKMYKEVVGPKLKELLFGSVLENPERYQAEFKVKSITYGGQVYENEDINALQTELREANDFEVNNDELSGMVITPNEEEYLYRMSTKYEWERMVENKGIWYVHVGTNVVPEESYNSGSSFVGTFEKNSEYAGITIRYKPPLLAYNQVFSGGQVFGKAFLPHYVIVEYLDEESGNWLTLAEQ